MNKNFYTYAKFDNMKSFKAFDVNEGYCVDRLIYATLIADTEENKTKLQRLADMNKEINLKLQLRDGKGKIMFETK